MSQQKTNRHITARVSLGDSLNSELKNQLESFKLKLKPVGAIVLSQNSLSKPGVETQGIKASHLTCPGCGLNIKV